MIRHTASVHLMPERSDTSSIDRAVHESLSAAPLVFGQARRKFTGYVLKTPDARRPSALGQTVQVKSLGSAARPSKGLMGRATPF